MVKHIREVDIRELAEKGRVEIKPPVKLKNGDELEIVLMVGEIKDGN